MLQPNLFSSEWTCNYQSKLGIDSKKIITQPYQLQSALLLAFYTACDPTINSGKIGCS